jgi:hypothetical protein
MSGSRTKQKARPEESGRARSLLPAVPPCFTCRHMLRAPPHRRYCEPGSAGDAAMHFASTERTTRKSKTLDAPPRDNGGLPAGATGVLKRSRSSRVAARRTPHRTRGRLPRCAPHRACTVPGSLPPAPRVLVPRDDCVSDNPSIRSNVAAIKSTASWQSASASRDRAFFIPYQGACRQGMGR